MTLLLEEKVFYQTVVHMCHLASVSASSFFKTITLNNIATFTNLNSLLFFLLVKPGFVNLMLTAQLVFNNHGQFNTSNQT